VWPTYKVINYLPCLPKEIIYQIIFCSYAYMVVSLMERNYHILGVPRVIIIYGEVPRAKVFA